MPESRRAVRASNSDENVTDGNPDVGGKFSR